MIEEQRCPTCGRLVATLINSQTIQGAQGTMTLSLYSVSSIEPHCFGYHDAQPTGGLKDLQRLCKRQSTPSTPVAPDALSKYAKPVDVPQAFYEAFKDKELEL